MPLQKIGKMNLKNQGGFVTRIVFSYTDDNGDKHLSAHSGDIPLGQSKTADPGDLGVPDGSIVSMYAFVLWGRDNEAKRIFHYEKSNPSTARYNISGTTYDSELGLVDVS